MAAILKAISSRRACSNTMMMPFLSNHRLSTTTIPSGQAADSCLQLGKRLQQQMAAEGSNLVFSPMSIRVALSIATNLLVGEKRSQYLSFLGATDLAGLNSAAARLFNTCRRFDKLDGPLRLSFPNGVWINHLEDPEPYSQEVIKSIYHASTNSVDFSKQAAEVTKEINRWVDKETAGRIKEILHTPLSDYTRKVVVNALYFKGLWKYTLRKCEWEHEKIFFLLDRSTIKAPFLTGSGERLFSSFNGFKVLSLPYKQDMEKEEEEKEKYDINFLHTTRTYGDLDEGFSMLFFLPNKRAGLNGLANKIFSDPSFIDDHIPKTTVYVDTIRIPEFKFSSSFDATKLIEEMGMDTSFTTIKQVATIEVDKEGTIATAATIWYELCDEDNEESTRPDVTFIADHPFLFAIRENTSGQIVFFGHVANPLSQ